VPKPSGNTPVNLPPWLNRILENHTMLTGAAVVIGFLFVVIRRLSAKFFSRKSKAAAPATLPSVEALPSDRHLAELEELDLQSQLNAAALKEVALKSDVLIKRLRNTVGKDAPLAAHIVRGWIDESN
jgi:flagellar biosynthesis/type III secretory pathway M-ring protein FliF/YscJ